MFVSLVSVLRMFMIEIVNLTPFPLKSLFFKRKIEISHFFNHKMLSSICDNAISMNYTFYHVTTNTIKKDLVCIC